MQSPRKILKSHFSFEKKKIPLIYESPNYLLLLLCCKIEFGDFHIEFNKISVYNNIFFIAVLEFSSLYFLTVFQHKQNSLCYCLAQVMLEPSLHPEIWKSSQ